jgi:hypothetical protein
MTKFQGSTEILKSLKDSNFISSANLFGQSFTLNACLQRLREVAYIPRLKDPLDLGTEISAFFKLISQVQQLQGFDLTGKNQWLQLLVNAEPQEFEENYLQILFDIVNASRYKNQVGLTLTLDIKYNRSRIEYWKGMRGGLQTIDMSEVFYLVRDHILQENLLEIRAQQSKEVVFSGGISNPRFVKKIELDGDLIPFPNKFFEGTPNFDSDFESTLLNLLEIFMGPYEINDQNEFRRFVRNNRDPSCYEEDHMKYEIPFVADMTISYNNREYIVKDTPFLLNLEHDLDFNSDDWGDFHPLDPTKFRVSIRYASEEIALGLICQALFHKKDVI